MLSGTLDTLNIREGRQSTRREVHIQERVCYATLRQTIKEVLCCRGDEIDISGRARQFRVDTEDEGGSSHYHRDCRKG